MANYVEANLGKDEKIIEEAKISWLTLIPSIIRLVICLVVGVVAKTVLAGLNEGMDEVVSDAIKEETGINMGMLGNIIFLVLFVYGVWKLVKRILLNMTTHLAITNKRIIGKTGIFSISAIDYPINKIDNVTHNASFWGKILHYSTITIKSTNGYSGTDIKGIGNAQQFKNTVIQALEEHAEEARKAQAAEIARAMGR